MTVSPGPRLTPEEYLATEREASAKSEYVHGEVFAMVGASAQHALITSNLVRELGTQLKGRDCRVFASDLRVLVSDTGLYTYPDVVVACGPPRFADDRRDTLLNPVVLVEVLSESTQDYDRGGKFEHYRGLDSLREYVLVAQDRPHLEHFVRQPDGRWLFAETNRLEDAVALPSIGCTLALAEVYDKAEWAPPIAPGPR